MTEGEQKVYAIGTLAAGLGTALGIALIATGRAKETYPIAAAVAVSTAFLAAAYTLGGDAPPRLRP
jgi:hypothetical protein